MLKTLFSTGIESVRVPFAGSSNRVVFIFGWAAGDMRHVQKCAKVWSELATEVHVISTPLGILKQPSDEQIAEQIRPLIEQSLNHHPSAEEIIIHSFSNGGLIYATRAITLLEQHFNRPVSKAVFDSAPSLDMSPETPAAVVSAALPRSTPAMVKSAVYYFVWSIISLLSIVVSRSSTSLQERLEQRFGLPTLRSLKCPSLFLFSTADKLTNSEMLAKFVRTEMTGGSTKMHNFVDSPHVAHFLYHRAEYEQQVKKFV